MKDTIKAMRGKCIENKINFFVKEIQKILQKPQEIHCTIMLISRCVKRCIEGQY